MKQVVYRKIILTHDGSRLASTAIPHALAVATAFQAEVLLLHVVESAEQTMVCLQIDSRIPVSDTVTDIVMESVAWDKKRATKQLNKIKASFAVQGIQKVKILVAEGVSNSTIVDTVKKQKCDLVIMSTHGRSGLGKVLLGSIADHVVRHAPCPVMLVHPTGG